MSSSAKAAFFVIALGVGAAFSGCSDDPADGDAGDAGQAGEATQAGSGGKANTAGSVNSAGEGAQGGEFAAGGAAAPGGGGDTAAGGDTTAGGEPAAGGMNGAGGAMGVANECNSLPYGDAVFAEYVTALEPDPEGGDIVDGVYHLTALVHYGSEEPSTSNDPIHSAIQFDGGAIEWSNQAKEEPATGSSFTYTIDGSELALTNVCPTPGPGDSIGYTATETTITLFLDAVYTFTLN